MTRVYGSGPVNPGNLTDDQIRDLRSRIEADPAWGGGPGTRTKMIASCDRALDSRIYRGAVAAICNVINEELA